MKILVTGGAGYIGSVVVETLIAGGHEVVILDSLERGFKQLINPDAKYVQGNVSDAELLKKIFAENKIDGVIHMAGYLLVAESVQQPQMYFENNAQKPMALIDAMLAAGVKALVFSSTAAVYGAAEKIPITEDAPTQPINPYGQSKLQFEQQLFAAQDRGLHYAALRYFNAAGASQNYGELHDPETHLIPIALQAAAGQRQTMEIFGNDYPTADGTNVRDYVHVLDIAAAHTIVLQKLLNDLAENAAPGKTLADNAYNIGTGTGYSTKQIIDAVEQVTAKKLNVKIGSRRPGDPPTLIASPQKLMALGWKPQHSELKEIIFSAWNWKIKSETGKKGGFLA